MLPVTVLPVFLNAQRKQRLHWVQRPPGFSFTISLPLAWRNVVSGLILMFARGMSEFGAVIVVAYHPMITPVLIYERFGSFGLKYARPVSVLFILISLALFITLRWLAKEKNSEIANSEIRNY